MERPMPPGDRPSLAPRGFAYIALLLVLAAMTLLLGVALQHIDQAAQREREAQLLFVGKQFRQALASYYEKSPGGAKHFPRKLEELLQDNRFAKPVRHLRRIYADPMRSDPARSDSTRADTVSMAGSKEPGWQLVRDLRGGIVGVHSRSQQRPIRSVAVLDDAMQKAIGEQPVQHYADWKFVYLPPDGAADLQQREMEEAGPFGEMRDLSALGSQPADMDNDQALGGGVP